MRRTGCPEAGAAECGGGLGSGDAGTMEPDAPGMHTSQTIDYGVVVRGEVWLELDDGAKRLLKPGDCVIQNGTRHAWHNTSSEECVMAFVVVGANKR